MMKWSGNSEFDFFTSTFAAPCSMTTLLTGHSDSLCPKAVRARGGDLTKEQNFWSISQAWDSIHSSNVVKNPHPGAKYQTRDK